MSCTDESDYWSDMCSCYISFRLKLAGYHVPLSVQTNKVSCLENRLCIVGFKYENNYDEMMEQILSKLNVSPCLEFSDYSHICEKYLFPKGSVTADSIIRLFALSGLLAMKLGYDAIHVEKVVDWMTVFIDSKLSNWIEQNGGLSGIIDLCVSDESHTSAELCNCACV